MGQLAWVEPFLAGLAATGHVTKSVELAGTQRQYVYDRRQRNLEFARQWKDALEHYELTRAINNAEKVLDLEEHAWKRALVNDSMLKFMLQAHRPATYDRAKHIQHSHSGKVSYQVEFKPQKELAHHTIEAIEQPAEGENAQLVGTTGIVTTKYSKKHSEEHSKGEQSQGGERSAGGLGSARAPGINLPIDAPAQVNEHLDNNGDPGLAAGEVLESEDQKP